MNISKIINTSLKTMKNIIIHEVGLRDGLQNESKIIPSDIKIKWIEILINSGIDIIQVGSFVNPSRVPQMADTDELFKELANVDKKNSILSGLVLNEKGLDRALDCGVDLICMGMSASETHSTKNTGKSSEDALKSIINMGKKLLYINHPVQVSVQSAFGCGFEGKIEEKKVINICKLYIDNGLMNISLADTAGHAYPEQVKRIFLAVKGYNDKVKLTAHIHNTYGLGIANCYAAIDSGAEIIETAFGGLGGCPFTKVAAGNVSTEDFVAGLQRNNLKQNINIDLVLEVSKEAQVLLERKLQSYVLDAGRINY